MNDPVPPPAAPSGTPDHAARFEAAVEGTEELGVDSDIVKPVSLSGRIRVMTEPGRSRLEIAELADGRCGT